MLIGYMRVPTDGDRQTLNLQRDALLASGVDERHLFEDRVSGAGAARVGLTKALAFMKPGDCLVVWKLDRLGRSLPHLITTTLNIIVTEGDTRRKSPARESRTREFCGGGGERSSPLLDQSLSLTY